MSVTTDKELRLTRRHDHGQLTAFEFRHLLNLGDLFQFVANPLQHLRAKFLMGHFAPPKPQGHFDLIAIVDKSARVPHLHVVIMGIDVGPQLDLFHVDRLLPLAGDIGLFLIFVFELAEIDDFADRRRGVRRHFNQVEVYAVCSFEGVCGSNDADLLAILIDQPNLGTVDVCIYPRSRAFRWGNVYWSSSDVFIS